MGGGKGSEPTPTQFPSTDNSASSGIDEMIPFMEAMTAQMNAVMEATMTSMTSLMDSMPQITAPQQEAYNPVDWNEKQDQLKSQAEMDMASEADKRHGTTSTIHTSPLLDDEDVSTTLMGLLAQ